MTVRRGAYLRDARARARGHFPSFTATAMIATRNATIVQVYAAPNHAKNPNLNAVTGSMFGASAR